MLGTPPVPVTGSACCPAPLLRSLSLTVIVAFLVPDAWGVNTTSTSQVAPGPRVPTQEAGLGIVNSGEFVIVMLEIVNEEKPLLLMKSGAAGAVVPRANPPKPTPQHGEKLIEGCETNPEMGIGCVEPATLESLSVNVIVAVRLPAAVGVNTIANMQVEPAGRLPPKTPGVLVGQFDEEKSKLKSPAVSVMLLIVSVALPELDTV